MAYNAYHATTLQQLQRFARMMPVGHVRRLHGLLCPLLGHCAGTREAAPSSGKHVATFGL